MTSGNLSKKLHNTSGETLLETLVSLLIATVALFFLAGAVVTSTNINKQVESTDVSFNYPDEASAQSEKITVTLTDTSNNKVIATTNANKYTDETGYYSYYEEAND